MAFINLTDQQVEDMAAAALSSYEMTADWSSAYRAAAEYSVDELGGRARPSAVKLALKLAKVAWMARCISTRKAIDAAT